MRIEDVRLDIDQLMHQESRQGYPQSNPMPQVLESESMAWTRGGSQSPHMQAKAAYEMLQDAPTVHTSTDVDVASLTARNRSPSSPTCFQGSSEEVHSMAYLSHDLLLKRHWFGLIMRDLMD